MTTEAPPKFYFNDIIFNSEYYQDEDTTGFSQDQADLRYLKKNITDTATALETFSGGIKTNSIETINDTDTLNISTVSTTAVNIVNIGNTTTNEQTLNLNSKTINVGDTSVGSSVNILSTSIVIGNPSSGTISFGSNAIATQITPSTSSMYLSNLGPANGDFNLCLLQNTGILNIGTATGRTAAINIATTKNTTTAQAINIGSSNALATGQTININRPLTLGYTVNPTSLNQIGGIQAIAGSIIAMASATPTTLLSFTSLPLGVYMIFYAIDQTTSFLTLSITLERHAITNSTNSFTSIESNISARRAVVETATTAGGSTFNIDYTINNSGIITVSPTNENIFVVAQFDHTNTGTGNLFSRCDARVVRIG